MEVTGVKDLVRGQLKDALRMAWAHLLVNYGELRLLVRGGSNVEKPGAGSIPNAEY